MPTLLRSQDLLNHLDATPLVNVYVLCGDDDGLLEASATHLTHAFQSQHPNAELHRCSVQHKRDWEAVQAKRLNPSLWSPSRVVHAHLFGKWSAAHKHWIQELSKNAPPQCMTVLRVSHVRAALKQSTWFKTLPSSVVFVEHWPLEGQALLRWVQHHALVRAHQLTLTQPALLSLVQRCDQQPWRLHQELQKLCMASPKGTQVDEAMVHELCADLPVGDLQACLDPLFAGDTRALTRFHRLLEQHVAPAQVLWHLQHRLDAIAGLQHEGRTVLQRLQLRGPRAQQLQQAAKHWSPEAVACCQAGCAWVSMVIKGYIRVPVQHALSILGAACNGQTRWLRQAMDVSLVAPPSLPTDTTFAP